MSFQRDWMDPELHPQWSKWIRPVSGDSNQAHCAYCRKNFSLSNMGQTAIKSHAKHKKHKENAIIVEKNPRLNFAAPAKTIARDTAQPSKLL